MIRLAACAALGRPLDTQNPMIQFRTELELELSSQDAVPRVIPGSCCASRLGGGHNRLAEKYVNCAVLFCVVPKNEGAIPFLALTLTSAPCNFICGRVHPPPAERSDCHVQEKQSEMLKAHL